MTVALKRLLTSAKFWTAIIGLVFTLGASLVAKYGIDASDAAIQQIALTVSGIFAVLLGAQGAAGVGKEAAELAANQTKTLAIEGKVLQTSAPADSEEIRVEVDASGMPKSDQVQR